MFKKYKTKSGINVIEAPISNAKPSTVLVMVRTGSRFETKENNGISHFLEHMFFKGTEKRPDTMAISGELDGLGAAFNAFTSKEFTGYWVKIDNDKIEKAMDIVSDMLINSKFETEEIEREKGVIVEEINMVLDNPMAQIEDVFEECLYGDTAAGRDVLGPKDNIRNFTRDHFVDYFKTQYVKESIHVCVAGDMIIDVEEAVEKYFGSLKQNEYVDKEEVEDIQGAPQLKIRYKDSDQIHLSLGVRAYATEHQDEDMAEMLANMLGGSMSSRLFIELRERRGLAYYVHTGFEAYTDTGYITTMAGVPISKSDEAVKVILEAYNKIKEEKISEEELARNKEMLKGRTTIRLETSDRLTNWYGRQVVLRKNIDTPEEYIAKMNALTVDDLNRVANDIFKKNVLNLAMIGPIKDEDKFGSILALSAL